MDTNTKSSNPALESDSHLEYEEKRKAMDPMPWIKPATMERFSEQQRDSFCVYHPRVTWPEHGGRMVRRDYLRPGDRAASSHYGKRTVKFIKSAGTEGQTTTIVWLHPKDGLWPMTESYDSSSMIELLSEEG